MIRDLVETGQSILMLGRPGVGKTTALREIARVLADELQ
jgi:stage III sporulation protein SpoIIIAA